MPLPVRRVRPFGCYGFGIIADLVERGLAPALPDAGAIEVVSFPRAELCGRFQSFETDIPASPHDDKGGV